MNEQQPPANGNRLERIERALEHLVSVQASHEIRLDRVGSQIEGLVGLLRTLVQEADRRFRQVDQRFLATDDKLNALIRIADDIVRKPPQPGTP